VNITDIQALVNQQFPNAVIVEEACKEALLLRPESAGDHAELLCMYAEAISTQPHRNKEAARYADRAQDLAVMNNLFFIAVRAACTRITCLAASHSAKEVIENISALRNDVVDTWGPQMQPTTADANRASGLLFGLEKFGQQLMAEHALQST
jgi:hypothetical protein